jgi:hypothetical protein
MLGRARATDSAFTSLREQADRETSRNLRAHATRDRMSLSTVHFPSSEYRGRGVDQSEFGMGRLRFGQLWWSIKSMVPAAPLLGSSWGLILLAQRREAGCRPDHAE